MKYGWKKNFGDWKMIKCLILFKMVAGILRNYNEREAVPVAVREIKCNIK